MMLMMGSLLPVALLVHCVAVEQGKVTMWSTNAALNGAMCEYANPPVNSITDPVLASYLRSGFHCAIGDANPNFGIGEQCGKCYRVTSLSNNGQFGTPGSAGSAVVMISDKIAEGGASHFDCNLAGFKAITGAETGVFDMEFEETACDGVTGTPTIINWADQNEWYCKMMFENVGSWGSLSSVKACLDKSDGAQVCNDMQRFQGQTWIGCPHGAGTAMHFELTQLSPTKEETAIACSCSGVWPWPTGQRCSCPSNFLLASTTVPGTTAMPVTTTTATTTTTMPGTAPVTTTTTTTVSDTTMMPTTTTTTTTIRMATTGFLSTTTCTTTTSQAPKGFIPQAGVCNGDTLQALTGFIDECAASCSRNRQCDAFSMAGTAYCITYSSPKPELDGSDNICYVKDAATTSEPEPTTSKGSTTTATTTTTTTTTTMTTVAPTTTTALACVYDAHANTAVRNQGTGGNKLKRNLFSSDEAYLEACMAECNRDSTCGGFVDDPTNLRRGRMCKPKKASVGYMKPRKTFYVKGRGC